jgi:Na+-transporting methylmalonyl-CoA/oxaloacetate decarboxylase gamma subunit
MSPPLVALQITAIGMGLVFGAILVLCGLMYLLTALLPGREEPLPRASAPLPVGSAHPEEDLLRLQAAAAALALALAEQTASAAHPLPPPPTAIVSAWQLGMRTRQMYQKGSLSRIVRS